MLAIQRQQCHQTRAVQRRIAALYRKSRRRGAHVLPIAVRDERVAYVHVTSVATVTDCQTAHVRSTP